MRQPPQDGGPLIVRPIFFTDEPTPTPRATRGTCPALRAGDVLYVRVKERPDDWTRTTIMAVQHSTVHVHRDE